MNDIKFHQELTISVGRPQNEGELTLGGARLPYSAPASLHGKGTSTNPEELLISAVGACFSLTLAGVLSARHLPATRLKVAADGVVVRETALEFRSLTVHPTFYGAAPEHAADYRQAAETALKRCFIGSLISPKVKYCLGEITLMETPADAPPAPKAVASNVAADGNRSLGQPR
jgi:organic hydroperoxide reductase OsmC/OhrA